MGDILETTEVTQTTPILLTQGAVEQLNQIREEQSIPADHALRVGVKGGGCSGFSYVLGFDAPQDNDDVFETNGIRVVMDKAHAIYLLGMQIDFHNDLNNRGFTLRKPECQKHLWVWHFVLGLKECGYIRVYKG